MASLSCTAWWRAPSDDTSHTYTRSHPGPSSLSGSNPTEQCQCGQLVCKAEMFTIKLGDNIENVNPPNVKHKIHEVLEGGGHVLAAETRHVLSHVSSENLVKWRRLLAVVVDVLRNVIGYEVRLLQGLNQVP